MSTYSKLQSNAYQKMAFNAGMALIGADAFVPSTGVVTESAILGATTGGWQFNSGINMSDLAEDVDNGKPGMKQFQRFSHSEPHVTGTLLTIDNGNVTKIMPGSTATTTGGVTKATPNGWFEDSDYFDLWILTDYSTITSNQGVAQSGFFAIHMKNCLNVGGAQMQTNEDGKMTLPVDFRAFYDAENPDVEPYEIYFKPNVANGG